MQISSKQKPDFQSNKIESKKSPCPIPLFRFLALAVLILINVGLYAQQARIAGPIAAPTISKQPVDNHICLGGAAIFQVTSTGTSFQWQIKVGSDYINLSEGNGYMNTTSAAMYILSTTLDMAEHKYRCVISNAVSTINSGDATLFFHADPVINSDPSSLTILTGSDATFTVRASNAVSFKWQVDIGSGFVDVPNGAPYSGATTTALKITGATAEMSGFKYQAIAKGACDPTATSGSATLTLSSPPQFTVHPLSSTVCAGGNVSFTTTATNAIGYQWMVNKGAGFINLNEAAPYSGTTTSTLTITGALAGMNTYAFKVVATGSVASNATSDPATLSVNAAPSITQEPSDATVCEGANTSFTVVSSAASGYHWQVDDGSGLVEISDGGKYSGAATNTLSIVQVTSAMSNFKYLCEVSGICTPAAISHNATLTVNLPGQWLGLNPDWNDTGNWSCGKIPDENTDVIINSAVEYMPEINVYDAVCNSLTIESGASLTVASGMLNIKGNVTNNGTFERLGPIVFSGDGQIIPEGSYEEIDILGSGTATLGGNVYIDGLLVLEDGYIQLGGYDLTMGAARSEFIGGDPSSFIITNGTGKLKMQGLGTTLKAGPVTFPVGASPSSFTPVIIKNAGTTDVFSVRVIDGIYASYTSNDEPVTGSDITAGTVKNTWFISEGLAGGSNVTLTFLWSESNEQPDFSRTACFGSHYVNGKWVAGTPGSSEGEEYFSTSLSGISTFSPFGIGSVGSALPLKLISFTGSANDEYVNLKWQTVSEINTNGFDVEVSKNAIDFKKIGYVKSLGNNLSVTSNYEFNAAFVLDAPVTYYRLKMLDVDGTFAYSKIISIKNQEVVGKYQIFPNPVQGDYLTVQPKSSKAEAAEIVIFDTKGVMRARSLVESRPSGADPLQIPLKNLPHGSEGIIRITEVNTGIVQTFKFVRK
jgi:hypothetical protein